MQGNAVFLQRFLYQSNLQAHNFFNLRFVERKYEEKALELTGRVLANVAFYGKTGLKE